MVTPLIVSVLDADHGGLLTNLLRYPSPSPTYPFEPSLIMSQALLLRSNVTPATGVEVVIQNQETLGVKAQPPEPAEPTHPARRRGGGAGGGGQSSRGRPPPQVPRGVQGLAAGLFERAQAAGEPGASRLNNDTDVIHRSGQSDSVHRGRPEGEYSMANGDSVLIASTPQKNLPDSATAYSYFPNLPFSPTQAQRDQSGQWSSIPNSISALPRHYTPQQYPIPPPVTMPHTISSASIDSIASVKTLRDAERELAEIRLAMIGMGKAMTEWLDRLPTDTTPEVTEGLERVKESLLDAGSGDTEALVKEWGWNESLESRTNSRSATPSGGTDHLGSHAGPLVTSAGGEEETPKAPEVDVLLPPPQPSSLPATRTAGQIKPPLYLSSRQDSPSAGLTRSPALPSRPNDSTGGRQDKEVSRENENRAGTQPDPLAGLGVGIPSPGFQDGRLKSRRDITTDPLRGL